MTRFYEPDLTVDANSPFVRDASNKLVRRSYWMDMTDKTLVTVMTQGIGANLTNDEKRAHLIDLKRQHLIDQLTPQSRPSSAHDASRTSIQHAAILNRVLASCCLGRFRAPATSSV